MTSVTGGNINRAGASAEPAYGGWVLAGATIFFGAFFLFQVEPLIAKAILPWFGGSAQVWTSCLLFFQTGLLCGYLYAHLLAERVPPVWQVRIHIALLVLSLAVLPIFPSEFWKPTGDENPLLMILGLLTATIGLPFFLLSATNPLVQSWLARSQSRAPYQLFALSNFGSMLALLSYPIIVEPFLPLRVQTWTWSIGYALFVVLCATTAWRYRSGEQTTLVEAADAGGEAPTWSERGLWFGLAALPSAMLLAVTNFLLQNVAAIPLFWILPLALYLLSFIVAFGSLRWYYRPFWYLSATGAVVAMILAMSGFYSLNDFRFLPLFTICLFVVCLVCHGELASMRPRPRYLTSYYLIIAGGGAFGGLFVAAVAPLVFIANFELQIIVPLTAAFIILAGWWRYRFTARTGFRDMILMVSLSILSGATSYMAVFTYRDLEASRLLARNFYGSLRVTDLPPLLPGDERRLLLNGSINHGEQYLSPDKRREPVTYFSRASGMGIALDELGKDGPLKVGVTADLICITAGLRRKPDESRLDLINRNVELFRQILDSLRRATMRDDAIIFVVSNPVDLLTRLAIDHLELNPHRVIGLGTQLDTVRFRSLIAAETGLPASQIKALILGEHGDSMVPIWSSATVAGVSLAKMPNFGPSVQEQVFERTKRSGAEVISLKGGAGWAVALAIAEVIHTIALDQPKIFPISTQLDGEYGIDDVCLSVPTRVNRFGVAERYEFELWAKELTALRKSASQLEESYLSIHATA